MRFNERRLPSSLLLLGLAVVLFAVSAKLALIKHYGTDQPYADQWAAEGMYLLRNPLYEPMPFGMVIAPHGEHRPALMRLVNRGLIVANEGQWDPYVELVANLLIYAAFLAITWRWIASLVRGPWLVVVAVIMAVLFAQPCVYENYLWGFQSSFLFMFLCGVLHLYGTLAEMRLRTHWWLGQLAGFFGLFSIAAGSMSAAALIVMAGIHLMRRRRNAWVWATLLANGLLLGFGLWMLPPGASGAHSHLGQLGAVVIRTGYLLSWPFAGGWWSFMVQAPCLVLLIAWWRNRDAFWTDGDEKLVALTAWVGCMAFAIAYGREITPQTIGVRYYDVLVLGLFLNALVVIRMVPRWTGWRRWLWCAAGVGWLCWIGWGLWGCNYPGHVGTLFKFQHDLATEQQRVVRDFLASNDPAPLKAFDDYAHRFPHFQITLDLLRDPNIRPHLPPSLTVDGQAGRLSRWARLIAGWWSFGLIASAVCFLAGIIRFGVKAKKSEPAWFAT
ncbi:MAG: hypothetical protein ABI222_07160 [Opitutaceae bacterium]